MHSMNTKPTSIFNGTFNARFQKRIPSLLDLRITSTVDDVLAHQHAVVVGMKDCNEELGKMHFYKEMTMYALTEENRDRFSKEEATFLEFLSPNGFSLGR